MSILHAAARQNKSYHDHYLCSVSDSLSCPACRRAIMPAAPIADAIQVDLVRARYMHALGPGARVPGSPEEIDAALTIAIEEAMPRLFRRVRLTMARTQRAESRGQGGR